MRIEIKEDELRLVLTDEELNNSNFVDVCLYSDEAKDGDLNTLGYVGEFTAQIDELYSAITAFKTLKDERKEM